MKLEVETVKCGGHAPSGDEGSLEELKIFREVDRSALSALVSVSQRESYDKGQWILGPGKGRDGTFVVLKGQTRMVRVSEQGSETTLLTLDTGDLFGLSLRAAPSHPKSTLEAAVDGTEVYRIDRERFREFVLSHPEVALEVIDVLGQRLKELADRIEEVARYSVTTRLARELVRAAMKAARGEIPVTHEELASRIGTRREEVTRAVAKLRKAGFILTPHRGVIVVPDPERLASEGSSFP